MSLRWGIIYPKKNNGMKNHLQDTNLFIIQIQGLESRLFDSSNRT